MLKFQCSHTHSCANATTQWVNKSRCNISCFWKFAYINIIIVAFTFTSYNASHDNVTLCSGCVPTFVVAKLNLFFFFLQLLPQYLFTIIPEMCVRWHICLGMLRSMLASSSRVCINLCYSCAVFPVSLPPYHIREDISHWIILFLGAPTVARLSITV